MKKLTLLLIAACFAVSLQAQMLGEAAQIKAFKEFKMADFNGKLTHSSNENKIAATSTETDTLHPQCMYFACADDGKLYSYIFGPNPEAGSADDGKWNQILGGTNSSFNFAQTYFPQFYGGEKEGYYFGANRAVTGVIMWVSRMKSPTRTMELVPSSMELYSVSDQEFWQTSKENMGDLITVPTPDKLQCVSQNVDIPCNVDLPGGEEKGFHQEIIYEFPCRYSTEKNRPFSIRWNLPRDSTLLVMSFSFKAGCVGEAENASAVQCAMTEFYQIDDGSGKPYLPETNPQFNNDSLFCPSALLFGEHFEFYWRPVVNSFTANDDIESIDFKASVYPIPASNELTISSLYKMNDIKIYNAAGQLIKTAKANGSIEFVDISSLTNGVYIAKINTEKGLITKKIIVKK